MKKIGAIAAASLFLLAACGSSSDVSQSNTEGEKSEASVSGSILVAGSSAMQPLVAAAAEEFEAENKDASVSVQAGGSGQGLLSVSNGQSDIGNSDVFAEEKDEIDAGALVNHPIAVVGMGPAAHPEVGIENLSKQQLIDIFTGKVTNWSEVGGADVDVTIVNRPDSSGTRDTFVNYALDGATPVEGITEESSNAVRQIISETAGAIGYLAFSYYDGSVTPLQVDDVEQTDENVTSGKYPIWAYMHSYTKGEPEGLTKDFIDYMLADTVQQEIIPELGYIPVADMKVKRDAEGNQSDI
ncbi:phosphate ABC transporter substrate-binding protein [Shouchella lonarensis]|uniref:Phosphate-binding protein n=1 Tax=Shouchella lonarensis TaxID=1464122 RepID=A0A1G6JYX1_9BACI|nr:phosphate ABC transporter substrate-binding protein [Shouchella lonarensis]SDC23930.1 phosphate ABC transporter substrate-binding protein, PhoT family [Shouchella lonarensis]